MLNVCPRPQRPQLFRKNFSLSAGNFSGSVREAESRYGEGIRGATPVASALSRNFSDFSRFPFSGGMLTKSRARLFSRRFDEFNFKKNVGALRAIVPLRSRRYERENISLGKCFLYICDSAIFFCARPHSFFFFLLVPTAALMYMSSFPRQPAAMDQTV